jgi:hypothetical protein
MKRFVPFLALVSAAICVGCKDSAGGPGAPAKLVVSAGDAQTATVNTTVTTAPAVKVTDASDRAVANVAVTFHVASGGGTITDSTPVTDGDGVAHVGSWKLGTTAGPNTLTAKVEGISGPLTITATGTAGPPAQMVLVSGGGQQALANTNVPTAIVLSVRDQFNNPATSTTAVSFAIVAGGGGVASASVTVGADGNVTAPAWRLGKSKEAQTLRATLGTLPAIDISATVQGLYAIDVRFFGPTMSDDQKALFTSAAHRLEGIIIGDVADALATNIDVAGICGVSGEPPLNETIDDVIIYASIRNIDGAGNILASAGPCLFRNAAGPGQPTQNMTAVGVMSFDGADIGSLAQTGHLQDVITHEMMHVLGLGTLWRDRGQLAGAGGGDPRHTGTEARSGCQAVGGITTCATDVPVENTGGAGTRDGHWRESTFDTELMTSFLDQGRTNPISSMTIGSFADLGFIVNGADLDIYTIPGNTLRAGPAPLVSRIPWETTLPFDHYYILENGRARKVPK